MSVTLGVVEIGDELGVIFPDEIATHLGAASGDTIVLREDHGAFHLSVLKETKSQKPES